MDTHGITADAMVVTETRRRGTLAAFGLSIEIEIDAGGSCFHDGVHRLQQLYRKFIAELVLCAGDVVIDIRAGIGCFSLLPALKFPDVKFYAFEPRRDYFEILQRNIAVLGLTNLFAVNGTVVDDWRDADPERVDGELVIGPTKLLARRLVTTDWSGTGDWIAGGGATHAVLFADVATALAPALVKFTAGRQSAAILSSIIAHSSASFVGVVGGNFDPIEVMHRTAGRMFALSLDGTDLVLREFEGSHPVLLSLIVPTFGIGEYLRACVESLLPGTANYQEWMEILVVVDDCKDPVTLGVVEEMKQLPGVRVLHKENGGCASARNFGLAEAAGIYVGFIDADDFVDPMFVTALLRAALMTGREIVQTSFDFADQEIGAIRLRDSYEAAMLSSDHCLEAAGVVFQTLDSGPFITGQPSIWRRLYRRDFLQARDLGFPQHVRAFDDLQFHFLTLALAKKIVHVSGPLYHYRQHAAQDVKQSDLRHLYELDMFRRIAVRLFADGIDAFADWKTSFVNTVRWSISELARRHLPIFCRGAGMLLALTMKAAGDEAAIAGVLDRIGNDAVRAEVDRVRAVLAPIHNSITLIHLEFPAFLPEFAKALEAVEHFGPIPAAVAKPLPPVPAVNLSPAAFAARDVTPAGWNEVFAAPPHREPLAIKLLAERGRGLVIGPKKPATAVTVAYVAHDLTDGAGSHALRLNSAAVLPLVTLELQIPPALWREAKNLSLALKGVAVGCGAIGARLYRRTGDGIESTARLGHVVVRGGVFGGVLPLPAKAEALDEVKILLDLAQPTPIDFALRAAALFDGVGP